ncbi:MAG: hypothetical protein MJ059_09250 [Lachnospiraceae bacterium]|nr:hypothetical protein [Lachnospiraceae bacterium]
MKFAAGYQNNIYGEPFADMIADYVRNPQGDGKANYVGEVYFPWVAQASGRPPLMPEGMVKEEAEEELISDLRKLKGMGVSLDLLFNANCYGEKAVSRSLEKEVISIIERLISEGVGPEIVTTTSPFIARATKKYYPEMEVRASVNMRIGTIQAMQYVSDLFDSFYIQRDFQRNLPYVENVSRWCHENGKKLCLLANSGCLRFCPGQTFHDNLIAHCLGASDDRVPDYNPHVCRNLYEGGKNAVEVLKSTWVRPEDIYRYEGLIDVVKLATRQHSYPRSVVSAYVNESWDGNLLELLEPGHSPAFYPYEIDNSAFPEDFFDKTGKCLNGCTGCGYCEEVLNTVYHKSSADGIFFSITE